MNGAEVDVLVLATHPDDAEIACAGAILGLVESGRSVAIVDMTRGEMGSRGTPELRAEECAAATRLLGVRERRNLELPDAGVIADTATIDALVQQLRDLRPQLLLAPLDKDVHPDHAATGQAAGRAFFLAGLKMYRPDLGPAQRPRRMLRYLGNDHVEPTFCLDISAQYERKREVIACYASQMQGSDKAHFVRGLDVQERTEVRDRYFGSVAGCAAAEPFVSDGPLPITDLRSLLP